MAKEYKYEKVSYEPSRLNNGEFIPRIAVVSNNDSANEDYREFQVEDIHRVLDFDSMPGPPPSDAVFGHLEFELDDDDTVTDDAPPKFPNRYFVLRGSFIFYFDVNDVDGMDIDSLTQSRFHQLNSTPRIKGKPLGVIPLERTVVEFPPGGRRCFREHAQTNARNGYEMMIRHMGRAGTGVVDASGAVTSKRRAPAYIVADSSGQRELWKKAIVVRADAHKKDTKLRPIGAANAPNKTGDTISSQSLGRRIRAGDSLTQNDMMSSERRIGGTISVLAGVLEAEEQKDIDEALEQFGNITVFEESDWVNDFFENNDELQSLTTSRKLERWQTSIKKGLRGAVLEQYEYFVEASKGMTIMGREMTLLRELVARQVDTIETMKNMSYEIGTLLPNNHIEKRNLEHPDDEDEVYSSDEDTLDKVESNDSWNDRTGYSSRDRSAKNLEHSTTSVIDVPQWLDEVEEEVSAFIKESRYSDATDLLIKAKNEINDIMNQHEKLTEKMLPKKQFATLQRILRSIDNLTVRICGYLSEGLRRKNDALRHMQKKERNDPLLNNSPLVSPVALNDDASALHLLVKLGRHQDAAAAYTARRSLLLSACLHERPICLSSHSVDAVIYAAQLSNSFFNSLAVAVEGFLDLFAEADKGADDHSELSSINTGSLKSVPSNALTATCYWCDTEISNFAAVFGAKVLSQLNLLPHTRKNINDISDTIEKFEVTNTSHPVSNSAEKDRKNSIEIAAKCIEQAFTFASSCLNTIGLPLTPRLAEYLRPKLKGTEAEIAMELGVQWQNITFNWKNSDVNISD